MSPALCFLIFEALLLSFLLGIQLTGGLLVLQFRTLRRLPVSRSQRRFWFLLLAPPFFMVFLTAWHLLAAAEHLLEEGQRYIEIHCPKLVEHCDLFLSWRDPEALVYILGFGLILVFLLCRLPAFPQARVCSCCASDSPSVKKSTQRLQELCKDIKSLYGLRLPPVRTACSLEEQAFVSGLLFQSIWISPRLVQTLSQQELTAVLLHEWAHVQRHDNLRTFFLEAWSRLSLFPSQWQIFRLQWRLDRELLCDDMSVLHCKAPLELGSALLKAIRLPQSERGGKALTLETQFVSLEQTILETRIHRLLEHSDGSRIIQEPLPPPGWRWLLLASFLPILWTPRELTLVSLHCLAEDLLHSVGVWLVG